MDTSLQEYRLPIGGDDWSYEKYNARLRWYWGWLYWLEDSLKEEGRLCVLNTDEMRWNSRNLFTLTAVTDNWKKMVDFELLETPNLRNQLSWCIYKDQRTRFILGFLLLKERDYYSGHANALIFDVQKLTVTRFEPHGKPETLFYLEKSLDERMGEWVRQLDVGGKTGWRYIRPAQVCPVPGPQVRDSAKTLEAIGLNVESRYKVKIVDGVPVKVQQEANGFCAVWSLIFIHLRIKNPDVPEEDIVRELLMKPDAELALMVREYTQFMVKNVGMNYIKWRDTLEKGKFVLVTEKTLRFHSEVIDPDFEYDPKDGSQYGLIIHVDKSKEMDNWSVSVVVPYRGRLHLIDYAKFQVSFLPLVTYVHPTELRLVQDNMREYIESLLPSATPKVRAALGFSQRKPLPAALRLKPAIQKKKRIKTRDEGFETEKIPELDPDVLLMAAIAYK